MEALVEDAERLIDDYRIAIRGIEMTDFGVLYSEVFFMRAAIGNEVPSRIVESGRARGMSTLLFSLCFPETEIVSIEFDGDSPHEAFAKTRLAERPNVEMLVGDSRELMPKLTRPGDIAVIDGPKEYRGLKLAFKVLRLCRPRLMFMHDCYHGSVERTVLDLMPHTFYSDDPGFERRFGSLDDAYQDWQGAKQDGAWRPHRFLGREQRSYGPTYACIPYRSGINWRRVNRKLWLRSIGAGFARSIRKRVGKTETA